ncbi:Fc.00g011480.m01.CDS01 [Cosmosporella sp. VM-42]
MKGLQAPSLAGSKKLHLRAGEVSSIEGSGSRSQGREKLVFATGKDRGITKAKMRLGLRMVATHRNQSLVLGALGCGVFGNPPEDVAHCWLEVLREDDFSGHWWREICFAIYDPKDEGNYDIFRRVLEGKRV